MVDSSNKTAAPRDIISDFVHRALQRRAMDAAAARALEAEMRRAWGGQRISHVRSTSPTALAERNSRIERSYLQGLTLLEISRAENVSPRHIINIIKRSG